MNNHNYHGDKDVAECSTCNSAMTESDNGNFLICDNVNCDNEVDLAEQYEADVNADHITEQIPNV